MRQLLEQVKGGQVNIDQAMERLRSLPYEDLGFARVDHHRQLRKGFPEVIFCPGKTTEQIVRIFESLASRGNNVLATRARPEAFEALARTGKFPAARYDELGRTITLEQKGLPQSKSVLPIVTAGTADLPVAMEAKITAEIMGQRTELVCDVGVAGLHRLLGSVPRLNEANVLIVVAGMEGALASVVGGLVSCPVIAVPTSVGYGANFQGVAALLTMLNSCASGIAVVNIDNGFSAAVTATMINRKIDGAPQAMEVVKDIPRLPPRPVEGHKGTFGRVLVVAGSVGMTGAAALSGRAALRAGSGLVRVATSRSALPIVAAIEPCYTTLPLAEDDEGRISAKALGAILDAVQDNDVVAVGPGMGQSPGLRSILSSLVQLDGVMMLIDGDGLNNLSRIPDWPKKRKAKIVLTPHPGEMKRLWSGLVRDEMPKDRQETAVRAAQATGAVVALKGAGTVVTDGRRVYVNTTGNPGMATAGSGDVLTGVTAALMGQDLDRFEATILGVYLHGLAGDIASARLGQISLMATDILDALPEAFQATAS